MLYTIITEFGFNLVTSFLFLNILNHTYPSIKLKYFLDRFLIASILIKKQKQK